MRWWAKEKTDGWQLSFVTICFHHSDSCLPPYVNMTRRVIVSGVSSKNFLRSCDSQSQSFSFIHKRLLLINQDSVDQNQIVILANDDRSLTMKFTTRWTNNDALLLPLKQHTLSTRLHLRHRESTNILSNNVHVNTALVLPTAYFSSTVLMSVSTDSTTQSTYIIFIHRITK